MANRNTSYNQQNQNRNRGQQFRGQQSRGFGRDDYRVSNENRGSESGSRAGYEGVEFDRSRSGFSENWRDANENNTGWNRPENERYFQGSNYGSASGYNYDPDSRSSSAQNLGTHYSSREGSRSGSSYGSDYGWDTRSNYSSSPRSSSDYGSTSMQGSGYGSSFNDEGSWRRPGRDSSGTRDFGGRTSSQTYGSSNYGSSYGGGSGMNYGAGERPSHGSGYDSPYGSAYGSAYGPAYGATSGSDYGYDRGLHSGKGPKGYQRSDERIREDVCEALQFDSQVDASDIDVRVDSGIVTLSGTVEDRRMKRMAEDCVEQCRGVSDVKNDLKVKNANLWDKMTGQEAKTTDTKSADSSKASTSKRLQ